MTRFELSYLLYSFNLLTYSVKLERPISEKLKEFGDQWQDKVKEDSSIKYKTLAAYSLDGTSFLDQLLNSSQPRPNDYQLYWHYPHYSNQGRQP